MSTELTVERVLELAEEAVAEYGADRTVKVCQIYDETPDKRKSPVCLVGVILHKTVGDQEFQCVESGTVQRPAASVGVDLSAPAANVLHALQHYQDGDTKVYDANVDRPILDISEHPDNPSPWGDTVQFVKANLETIVNHKTGVVA